MLVLGGIPWNCYFQRVLSCQTPAKAQWHSILAGLLTIGFTIPPLLLGVAAFSHHWPAALGAEIAAQPAETLPMIFRYLTPGWVGVLGLGAIIGAVTSSFSASILSAGSMIAWNGVYRLWRPDLSPRAARRRLIRVVVVALGAAATVMALEVQSVQALWFFTSDLVFVLLFPQLVFALFDRRVEPDRIDRGLRRLAGAPARRRRAAVRRWPRSCATRRSSRRSFRARRRAGTMPPARCCFRTRRWPRRPA